MARRVGVFISETAVTLSFSHLFPQRWLLVSWLRPCFPPVLRTPEPPTERLRDLPTARRSELKAATREAVRVILHDLMGRFDDPREPHEYQGWELPTVFNNIVRAAAYIDFDEEVFRVLRGLGAGKELLLRAS